MVYNWRHMQEKWASRGSWNFSPHVGFTPPLSSTFVRQTLLSFLQLMFVAAAGGLNAKGGVVVMVAKGRRRRGGKRVEEEEALRPWADITVISNIERWFIRKICTIQSIACRCMQWVIELLHWCATRYTNELKTWESKSFPGSFFLVLLSRCSFLCGKKGWTLLRGQQLHDHTWTVVGQIGNVSYS